MMKATTLLAQLLSGSAYFDFAKASSGLGTARLAVPRPELAFVATLLPRCPLLGVFEASVQGGLQQKAIRQALVLPLSSSSAVVEPVAKQHQNVIPRAMLGHGAAISPDNEKSLSLGFRCLKQLEHWRRLLRAISCSQQSPYLSS